MAFTATTILQLVVTSLWACLTGMSSHHKNPLFARFFTSLEVLSTIVSTASVCFCPGLFEVLQAATPPTIEVFKSLPTDTAGCWAAYAISMEKPGCRPLVYIGSGTSASASVAARFYQYDHGLLLPLRMEEAMQEGYVIVHKGMLRWTRIPKAALVPLYRLLFYGFEGTFAFLFWAMYAKKGDYGMGHICPWGRSTLEYDGLCSHPCFDDGIHGQFDLDAEQLEAYAVEREQKRVALKAENGTNWHYKQMETNYDEYIGKSCERVARSRANNPGRDAKHQADRVENALKEKTFHCTRCDISFGTKQSLQDHEKTAKHKRKLKESSNPFRCHPCNLGFHNKSNLTRHQLSDKHRKAVAAAAAAAAVAAGPLS